MKKTLIIFLVTIILIPSIIYAHPGSTDSDGGHTDSSTGEYHYHHGYSAHQHPNEICPYDFDDKTSDNASNYTKNTYNDNRISNNTSSTSNTSSDNDALFFFIIILPIIIFCSWIIFRHYNTPKEICHYSYPKSKAKPLPTLENTSFQKIAEEDYNENYYQLLTDLHYDYLSNNEILHFEESQKRTRLNNFSSCISIIILIIIYIFICILLWNKISLYTTLGIAAFIMLFLFYFKINVFDSVEQNITSEYANRHRELSNYYGNFLAPYTTPLFINQIIGAPNDTIFIEHLPIFQDYSHVKYVSHTGHCYHDKNNCMGNYLKFRHAFLCDTLSCCPFCGTPINIPDWYDKYLYIIQILNDFNIDTDNL